MCAARVRGISRDLLAPVDFARAWGLDGAAVSIDVKRRLSFFTPTPTMAGFLQGSRRRSFTGFLRILISRELGCLDACERYSREILVQAVFYFVA